MAAGTSALPPGGLLEIVFSFDTTGSMSSIIDEVKGRLQDMIQRLQADIPGIRIGVIAHGDYCDKEVWELDLCTDVVDLCNFVKGVEGTGGGDEDECYELILRMVRQNFSWTPASQKILVMIGDANPHEPEYELNVDDIDWRVEVNDLNNSGVKIYGVQAFEHEGVGDFYKTMATQTDGHYLKLGEFSNICDFLMAICYRERGEDLFTVYMVVNLIIRGLGQYEVYVDRFPDFRSVLVKPDDVALTNPEHEKCTYLFCSDATCLQDLFDNSGLLKQHQICFTFCWNDLFEKARRIVCESDFLEMIHPASANVYWCKSVCSLPELPKGYNSRSLRPEDYDTVMTWIWYADFDYVKSVKRVLRLGALSVGVESSSGKLVAWTLQHVTGVLGMTYVIPEHRNKTLGKYVTVALAQKMIAQDGVCMAGIEDGNAISVALHEGVGFTQMARAITLGLYYEKRHAFSLKQFNTP